MSQKKHVFAPTLRMFLKPPAEKRHAISTPHVQVMYDPALGDAGSTLAQAVAAKVEADYAKVSSWFPGMALPGSTLVLSAFSQGNDGTGGANHSTCVDTMIYVDASFAEPDRSNALFVAELSEVGQGLQGQGWDCGASNGEGLSRLHAETAYPGVLDDFATAPAWIDAGKPDWVNQSNATDTDSSSNGCSVLFLYWLISLGYNVADITSAAASTLAATYQKLSGKATAWDDFSAAVANLAAFTTDNPWDTSSPPPPPPPPAGLAVVFPADVKAGSYSLVPTPTGLRLRR